MKDHKKIKIARKYKKAETWQGPLVEIPHLSMCGEWLREAGFEVGITASVKIENQRITILAI
jgi:Toxin SymE, type I toxin-antitoxin system